MRNDLAALLPEICATRNAASGAPVLIKRGEMGYYPTWDLFNPEGYNARHGITPNQVEAMTIGSMFGWDVPGVRRALEDGAKQLHSWPSDPRPMPPGV